MSVICYYVGGLSNFIISAEVISIGLDAFNNTPLKILTILGSNNIYINADACSISSNVSILTVYMSEHIIHLFSFETPNSIKIEIQIMLNYNSYSDK